MSAPILGGMANFANNFTKAYGSEKRRLSDEEERKADRKWQQEQQDRQRTDWQRQDDTYREQAELTAALKDAGAVRNVEHGTVVDAQTSAGPMQRMFTKDPEQAAALKETMDAEAEMTGAAPAMAQPGTAITGKMSQGHQINTGMAAGPADKMADPNSNEEVAKRTAQAYRQHGQVDKAIQMENTIMEQKAKRMGLEVEQLKFIDMQTNRALDSALKSGATWYEGAAKFLTDLQSGGLKGVKAQYQLSPDGKSVTFFAVMPDGKKQATGIYPVDESGRSQFMDKFAALPIEKRMEIMQDKIRDERDQQNKNREFALQEAQDRRKAAAHAAAMASDAVPAAVKLKAESLAKELGSINSAINKARADDSFKPDSPNAQELLERQTALGLEYRKLLEPHIPGGNVKGDVLDDLVRTDKPAEAATTAATQETNKLASKPVAPAATYTPPLTMAEIQQKTRQNRERIKKQAEQANLAERDPDVVALYQAHKQAIRDGNPMLANAITAKINEVKAKRYGAQ